MENIVAKALSRGEEKIELAQVLASYYSRRSSSNLLIDKSFIEVDSIRIIKIQNQLWYLCHENKIEILIIDYNINKIL